MDQPTTPEPRESQPFAVGDAVQLKGRQQYLKTADPMPMLRPPDLVDPEELGEVLALKARNLLAVRFRRGTFLIEADQLQPPEPQNAD
ncbi:DUF3148 domain-containing protein [Cyanobium sp. Aljojuca 7D2]|uniref:NAD(P)H dehydrogenase assembly family protein n=1 Tax=Cyanobium sp. Aljojuca 7D2 TaxID=2823698 RepID=UPI0020CE8991|nr:NAD(P)H dehydrogenase assembly family protein [Cyanobium sp. Aljojuca 7D2]MCP9889741.1 DUF3148 domain-containing protein [Cyanobium sp. Aljojuca 7D2]